MNEQSIFEAARGITDSAAREKYLQDACGDDLQALQRIRERLESSELSISAEFNVGETQPFHGNAQSDERVGPYRLLQQIGEGGMGVVYIAEQKEPIRRQVALKVIKPGMDSKAVIARFEAERQTLAMWIMPTLPKYSMRVPRITVGRSMSWSSFAARRLPSIVTSIS
jgi:hypothetical protein